MAALCGALCVIGVGAPAAQAQTQTETPSLTIEEQALDPVTNVARKETLTQLRIAAIALDGKANQAEALSGIVGAFLRRGQIKNATIDFNVIADTLWRARTMVHFAAYERAARRGKKAIAILRRAAKLVDSDLAAGDNGETLALISRRQAELEDFAAARAVARRIPDPERRIRHLLLLGNMQNTVPDKAVAAGAKKTFEMAAKEAGAITGAKEMRLEMLLTVAQTMIAAGHPAAAARILDAGYRILRAQTLRTHTEFLSRIAASYVDANRKATAMDIVRSLQDDVSHARTLASVARAIAMGGSPEGAAALFLLAVQDTDAITEPDVRVRILTHIIVEQARSGLYASAFSTAGKIKDKDAQRQALFAMGRVMLAAGKGEEALKLVHYLPDIGMRAQIYANAARHRLASGDRDGAAGLLADSLAPTGAEPDPATLKAALPLVFEAQVELGASKQRSQVFARVRTLLAAIPDGPAKVPVVTRIARAEMLDSQKEAADRSLSLAWRISWMNKKQAVFPDLLNRIATAQLDVGDLLPAFDTAARIPEDALGSENRGAAKADIRERPKIKALTAVAVAAARRGHGQLALRAARRIADPTGRAAAYNAIALALPIRDQQARKPDRPDNDKNKKTRERPN
ncbi:MAG: hypothetical protein MJE12_28410 [Alphaproteobacteria bacterium]|nr:hypothetical protein [Alphaproteobacteria bacterium]